MISKESIKWLISCVLLFLLLLNIYNSHQSNTTSITYDTIFVYDTIIYPIAHDSVVKRYETIKLPVVDTIQIKDTICRTDSAIVEVPISQKTYTDSTYKAVISGFHVSLDSIFIKSKTITKTITETKYKPTKWGLGVSAGYDPINNNWGVMLGVQYNILPIK